MSEQRKFPVRRIVTATTAFALAAAAAGCAKTTSAAPASGEKCFADSVSSSTMTGVITNHEPLSLANEALWNDLQLGFKRDPEVIIFNKDNKDPNYTSGSEAYKTAQQFAELLGTSGVSATVNVYSSVTDNNVSVLKTGDGPYLITADPGCNYLFE